MKKKRPDIKFTGKVKDLLYLNSYISICGNEYAVIDNCKQILECTEVLTRVVTSNFEIEIWGDKLKLSSFDLGSVEVRGTIEQVKLVRHSRKID